jgi:hypothetical protein
VKAFADHKSSNNLLATYRQIAVQGDEPVFIKCAWSDVARQAAAEARRNKTTDPEYLLSKISEHDTAMHSARTPEEFSAHEASKKAYSLSDKAAASGSSFDHLKARHAHLTAHIKHFNADNKSEHAAEHKEMMTGHEEAMARIPRSMPAIYNQEFSKTDSPTRLNRDRAYRNGSDD